MPYDEGVRVASVFVLALFCSVSACAGRTQLGGIDVVGDGSVSGGEGTDVGTNVDGGPTRDAIGRDGIVGDVIGVDVVGRDSSGGSDSGIHFDGGVGGDSIVGFDTGGGSDGGVGVDTIVVDDAGSDTDDGGIVIGGTCMDAGDPVRRSGTDSLASACTLPDECPGGETEFRNFVENLTHGCMAEVSHGGGAACAYDFVLEMGSDGCPTQITYTNVGSMFAQCMNDSLTGRHMSCGTNRTLHLRCVC